MTRLELHHDCTRRAMEAHDKADRLARHGETLVSDTFRNEARKWEARAQRHLNFIICGEDEARCRVNAVSLALYLGNAS